MKLSLYLSAYRTEKALSANVATIATPRLVALIIMKIKARLALSLSHTNCIRRHRFS